VSESFAAGLVGVVLDERYRLDALLGEGGMGAVFRAHHLAMDRRVAVKLLKPHLTSDEAALQRFAREARSTMKVESDHAVKVLDFGITPHRDYYMVLEYLDGRTVQRELDVDGTFAPTRVIHIARQALRALGAAHDRGLVHRDIKPDNMLLMRVGDDSDFTKVLDFGVAKLMDGAAASSKSALKITQAGMVFGTPEFMSPEQACGQPLDGRSDLYSLAATMFAMLTGCGMFKATSPIEWLTHHARTPPPHLVEGLASLAPFTALDELMQRCLAKRASERPASAAEMIALLDGVEATMRRAQSVPAVATSSAPAVARSATLPHLPRQTEAVSTFLPSLANGLFTADVPSVSTGSVAVHGSRKALWLLLGAAVIGAMIVITIVAATRKRSPRESAIVAKPAARHDAGAVTSAADAGTGVVTAMPTDADVPATLDAGAFAPPDAGVATAVAKRHSPHPEVAAHLAAAEAAKASGNRLRQLAESDAALQADPRNVRARLLFADALIASGDLDRGCRYLRGLGRNPTAAARARQAGCPSN
jgi:eukaryotic-like serine/threonine-protein kinase